MQVELVQSLSAWLAATDIALLELRGPTGSLRLRHEGKRVFEEAESVAPDDRSLPAAAAPLAVTAPSVGVFLRCHPLHNAPLAALGAAVRAGQPLGLLRIGSLLLPVVAPVDGSVIALPVDDATVVGYGTTLIELQP